jgi:hypothetical protein
MILGFIAQADAQNNRNQREVRNIVQSLMSELDDFSYSLDSELRRTSISRSEKDDINSDVKGLEDAISQFEGKFQRSRESAEDVTDILNAAKSVNDFVNNRRYGSGFQTDWTNVRNLLDKLANAYKVNWNWNGGNTTNYPTNYPTNTNSSVSYGLTGTYDLDTSRSENSQDILDRANVQNDSDRADLEAKLEAAEQIAIDVRGNQVILASSKASPVNFTADGRDRTEQTSDGRTVRVRATLNGQNLTVSSVGGETDYTVTFASIDNGKSLKVTRRITTDYMNQTVFAESIYTKSASVAQLGIDTNTNTNNSSDVYSSSDSNDNPNSNYPNGNYPTTTTPRTGQFIVPNGTIITGTLNNDVTTKVSQNNDRFKMTVTAPNEYRGAVIEGYLSGINRSGKVSGRSQITFNFERIRLANGQTYDFAGFLQNITDTNGKTVKVGAEGDAKGDSQTKETVKRGGIGAGIGALIGAIAGGGKGAAIGAIIGGGAGAGSVILTGKEELDLKQGSSITVQASSPNR